MLKNSSTEKETQTEPFLRPVTETNKSRPIVKMSTYLKSAGSGHSAKREIHQLNKQIRAFSGSLKTSPYPEDRCAHFKKRGLLKELLKKNQAY